jgi:hypothetical protein
MNGVVVVVLFLKISLSRVIFYTATKSGKEDDLPVLRLRLYGQ